MKLNYLLKAFLVVFVLGGSAISVIANNPAKTESITENSDNWVLIKNENGIKIFVSEYENIDGTLALKIKIENTTNHNKTLSWSLVNNISKTVLSEKNSEINAMGSLIYMSEENPIPVNYGETLNDLTIIIK